MLSNPPIRLSIRTLTRTRRPMMPMMLLMSVPLLLWIPLMFPRIHRCRYRIQLRRLLLLWPQRLL